MKRVDQAVSPQSGARVSSSSATQNSSERPDMRFGVGESAHQESYATYLLTSMTQPKASSMRQRASPRETPFDAQLGNCLTTDATYHSSRPGSLFYSQRGRRRTCSVFSRNCTLVAY